ncbi:hypothetical protein Taro_004938 [Colocasia esculenta]|uniref:Uncharacterized protein n=1 Tax=Colocasia esculenta TaxID=4460 RepID=A0A843TT11_COLES|nr:hypothetical protein [Colocasia esculenta]
MRIYTLTMDWLAASGLRFTIICVMRVEMVRAILKEVEAMCTEWAREVAGMVGISSVAAEKDLKRAFAKIYRRWSASIRAGERTLQRMGGVNEDEWGERGT